MTIDTLALHRRSVDAGAEPKLAEAISTSIRDLVDGHAASKADLKELRAELRGDLDRLLLKMGVMLVGGFTLMFLALEYASR